MRRALLLSTGCKVKRARKRCRELARRDVKSGPNRSPRTYSILCLSGNGGTAHAGYSLDNVLYKNTKSVNRLRTEVVGFWKEGKVVYSGQQCPLELAANKHLW